MKRKTYLDIAKIMACLAVIIQHNVSFEILDKSLQNLNYFYYYICRFAVPVFVMSTGVLLLDDKKEISYSLILKKYIPRIFLPLVAIVYVIEITNAFILGTVSLKLLYQPFVHVVLNQVSVPYWYIYMIAGIYILLPYIRKIVNNCSKKEIEIFLLIFVFVRSIVPLFDQCLRNNILIGAVSAFQMSIFNGYIGYLILGHYIDKYLDNLSKRKYVICIIAHLVSTVIPIIIMMVLPNGFERVGDYFNDIFSLNIMVISVTFLLILKRIFNQKQIEHPIVYSVSKATFGIYILHVYVQQLFGIVGVVSLREYLKSGVLILSIANFLISFFIIKLVQNCKKNLKSFRIKKKIIKNNRM